MKKKHKLPMIILGIVLIIALIIWAGVEDTIRIAKSADLKFFSLAILMQFLATLAWALRWRVLLDRSGAKVSLITVLMAIIVGVFFNNLTPGARAGGEPARTYLIGKRSNKSYGTVFATVMADRILDVIPVMVFTFIAFKYALKIGAPILLTVLAISTLVLLIILGISLLLSINQRLAMKFLRGIINLLKKIFPKKFEGIEEKIEEKLQKAIFDFRKTLLELSKDPIVLGKSLFYSFALWGFMIVRSYYVFESIGYHLSLYKILMVQMAGIALGMISILPGGLGVTETINSALYLSLNIDKSLAVTATVLDRFISFWLPTIIGGMISFYLGVRHGDH